ncbi:MAG: glycosyltransferase family 2 protein [bacterium]|nr:glycosyltransferase family 2 protein [bacterium]
MDNTKLVTIVMATYNRSNIIGYSIKSVINQTHKNWELIVIGDKCTDDTEQTVASFNDPRITFKNLETNIGEQSGPNNIGLEMSNGQYIAILNHDDLWMDNHLETLIDSIESTDADLTYSWWISADRKGFNKLNLDPTGGFSLDGFYPASSWLFKSDLRTSIGPWKYFKEIHQIPSQDWIKRVFKKGKKISSSRNVSMIAVQSGLRKDSYINREYKISETWFNKLQEQDLLLKEVLLENCIEFTKREKEIFLHLKMFVWNILKYLVVKSNFSPLEVRRKLTYWKKGGSVNALRKRRGLKKIR